MNQGMNKWKYEVEKRHLYVVSDTFEAESFAAALLPAAPPR